MVDATKPKLKVLAAQAGAKARCPICRKPAEQEFRPFCSRRCSDVDLSRWLTGTYAIAGGSADADEDGDDGAGSPDSGGTRQNKL
jgi:uncharacterized protein